MCILLQKEDIQFQGYMVPLTSIQTKNEAQYLSASLQSVPGSMRNSSKKLVDGQMVFPFYRISGLPKTGSQV